MSIPKMPIPIMSTVPKCLFPSCLQCQNVYSFGKNELMFFRHLEISMFCHGYNCDLGQCSNFHGQTRVTQQRDRPQLIT